MRAIVLSLWNAKWIVVFSLYVSLFFLQQTTLAASDLGRHITNGQVLISSTQAWDWHRVWQLLSTNYYSYTSPEFPTLTHHWLFGVISFLIYQATNFSGLTIANSLLLAGTYGLALHTTSRLTSRPVAVIAGLLSLPLFTNRVEIRPETFSLFLLSCTLFLSVWFSGKRNGNTLLASVSGFLVTAFWVNIHIFFFLGPATAAIFWLQGLRSGTNSRNHKFFLAGLILGTVCTPLGLRGTMAPFTVFGNYGYMVVENMPLYFMLSRFGTPEYWYITGLSALCLFASFLLIKQDWRRYWPIVTLAVGSVILTWALNRFSNFASIFMLPVFAHVLQQSRQTIHLLVQKITKQYLFLSISSLAGTAIVVLGLASQLFTPQFNNWGTGLTTGSLQAAQFIAEQQLPQPIFNNYDVGGYLIFAKQPVFVDNRPEAYSAEFLQTKVIHPQESEESWLSLQAEYDMQTIFFYRHDQTPWAQPFLLRRIEDENWVPIYVDNFVLVLVKNTPENAQLIEKFQLPRSIFKVSS
ncbi:hypothetical protein KBC79_00220 [Candidatus Woesebacteria bacterium]|nr:hypothetical protein [Candidatus Woesebacteria bacterium]